MKSRAAIAVFAMFFLGNAAFSQDKKEPNPLGIQNYLSRARDPKVIGTAVEFTRQQTLQLKKELSAAKRRPVGQGGRGKKFGSEKQKERAIAGLEKRLKEANDYYDRLKEGKAVARIFMDRPLRVGRIGMIQIDKRTTTKALYVKNKKEFIENGVDKRPLGGTGYGFVFFTESQEESLEFQFGFPYVFEIIGECRLEDETLSVVEPFDEKRLSQFLETE